MKKQVSLLIAGLMSISLMAACTPTTGKDSAAKDTKAETSQAEKTKPATPAPEAKAAEAGSIVKMGVGIKAKAAKSKEFTAEKPGVAQADVVIAVVGLDKDGKVADIVIDNAQTKVEFNADGTLKTDPAEPLKTKVELKDEYGMFKASEIGREWYEQAGALGAWMQGKTIEEIKGMKTKEKDESHPAVPTEADLATNVSISVEDYVAAVEEAISTAVEVPEGADKVGLGVNISIAKSKAKTAEAGAIGQIDTTISGVAVKGDKVAANILDVVQTKVSYDAEGKITSDTKAEVKSKLDLGAEYNMKKVSAIGKEWNEQAEALTKWTIGKSLDEIKGLATEDKDGKKVVTDPDLKTSVSVGVADYLTVFEEAITTAN